MPTKNIDTALDNVELTYNQIVEIANNMLAQWFEPITELINSMGDDINELSVDQIKNYMWKLQNKAYTLSEIKEKSLMKSALAEALRKEKYALKFNEASGSAAIKENIALIESSEETLVQVLYDLVSSSLKTKVDQLHRLVDCAKSILMTRMQEARLSINSIE